MPVTSGGGNPPRYKSTQNAGVAISRIPWGVLDRARNSLMRSIAFIFDRITLSGPVFQFFQDHKGKENGLLSIKLAVSGFEIRFLIEIGILRESGFKIGGVTNVFWWRYYYTVFILYPFCEKIYS
jgi:hypothetical protein